MPRRLSSGSVTVRNTSTLGSSWSFVIPLNVMDKGYARQAWKGTLVRGTVT